MDHPISIAALLPHTTMIYHPRKYSKLHAQKLTKRFVKRNRYRINVSMAVSKYEDKLIYMDS